MLRDVILILATQGWQKLLDENDNLNAIDRLVEHFSIPLVKANVCLETIHSEFEGILDYACLYISLSTLEYRAVWWRVFHAPVSSEWPNALALIELLFSLPSSNGTVERAFSQMNVIKSKRRSSLSNGALDDLLTVASAQVPLKHFCPDDAIDLWWKDKVRRPNQKRRRPYRKRGKHAKLDLKMLFPVVQLQLQLMKSLKYCLHLSLIQSLAQTHLTLKSTYLKVGMNGLNLKLIFRMYLTIKLV